MAPFVHLSDPDRRRPLLKECSFVNILSISDSTAFIPQPAKELSLNGSWRKFGRSAALAAYLLTSCPSVVVGPFSGAKLHARQLVENRELSKSYFLTKLRFAKLGQFEIVKWIGCLEGMEYGNIYQRL